jgi:hypothetical protein
LDVVSAFVAGMSFLKFAHLANEKIIKVVEKISWFCDE